MDSHNNLAGKYQNQSRDTNQACSGLTKDLKRNAKGDNGINLPENRCVQAHIISSQCGPDMMTSLGSVTEDATRWQKRNNMTSSTCRKRAKQCRN